MTCSTIPVGLFSRFRGKVCQDNDVSYYWDNLRLRRDFDVAWYILPFLNYLFPEPVATAFFECAYATKFTVLALTRTRANSIVPTGPVRATIISHRICNAHRRLPHHFPVAPVSIPLSFTTTS